MTRSLFAAIVVVAAVIIQGTAVSAQHSGGPTGAPRAQCLSNDDLELIASWR